MIVDEDKNNNNKKYMQIYNSQILIKIRFVAQREIHHTQVSIIAKNIFYIFQFFLIISLNSS